MVALISIPAIAPRKTRTTPSRSRSSSIRNPNLRSMRYEQTGAAVLLIMIPQSESRIVSESVTMLSREPRVMPGQTPMPRYNRQPRAIPVDGQSGVTVAPWTVIFLNRPICPAP